jgi:cytochrome c oxidase assembly factor 4
MESDQQTAIEKTGCSELNDALLLCYDEKRDWRKCRAELQAFRKCYEDNVISISENHEKKLINMEEL